MVKSCLLELTFAVEGVIAMVPQSPPSTAYLKRVPLSEMSAGDKSALKII